jgi:hypothetical protein
VKNLLRKLFSPFLNKLESGTEPYLYKPSHRFILLVMGVLFSALGIAVLWFAVGQDPTYFLPVVVFGGAGFFSLLVALVGTERAVATIWGSKK